MRALVEDVERALEWQAGLTGMRALERNGEGRAFLMSWAAALGRVDRRVHRGPRPAPSAMCP